MFSMDGTWAPNFLIDENQPTSVVSCDVKSEGRDIFVYLQTSPDKVEVGKATS